MSLEMNRRSFCKSIGALTASASLPFAKTLCADESPRSMSLSVGNYGMQSFKVEDAIRTIAKIGFDGLELTMMDGWDSAPIHMPDDRRRSARQMIRDEGLLLNSLMEDLTPSPVDAEHQKTLDRLKQAAELGQDLAPDRRPVVQTVLGGGTWNEKKNLFRDRVGDWLRVTQSAQAILAIKPHRRGAMSQPADALWIIGELGNSPWLKMVYDYSHYAFRDLSIKETIEMAAPFTVQVAVKDAVMRGKEIEFALPGEANTIDYVEILNRFAQAGYQKDICCEVSSQVFRRDGYDPVAALKSSYSIMNQAFESAKVARRRQS